MHFDCAPAFMIAALFANRLGTRTPDDYAACVPNEAVCSAVDLIRDEVEGPSKWYERHDQDKRHRPYHREIAYDAFKRPRAITTEILGAARRIATIGTSRIVDTVAGTLRIARNRRRIAIVQRVA